MTPDEYCRDKAAKSGSSFYYSFLFLSEDRRQAITALYAFCRDVDDTVDDELNIDIARRKLDWWRQEIKATFKDNKASHPISQSLLKALPRYSLREQYFLEIIDGMAMDLEQFSYDSFDDLKLYCHRVASVVGLMAVEIFGYQDKNTLQYAKSLGIALQLTNIIRDVREDAERGRIYLPQQDLDRFNVNIDDILALKSSPELIALLQFQAERAKQYYQQALEQLPEIDRYDQRTGLIMAAIYRTTLDEIERDGFKVMEHRVRLTPIRKLWIAWKTARQCKRSRLK